MQHPRYHMISASFLSFHISCFFDVQSSPHFSPPFSVYHDDSGSQISSSMAAPLLASTSPGRGGFIPSKATRRYLSGGIGKHGRIWKKNMGSIRIIKNITGWYDASFNWQIARKTGQLTVSWQSTHSKSCKIATSTDTSGSASALPALVPSWRCARSGRRAPSAASSALVLEVGEDADVKNRQYITVHSDVGNVASSKCRSQNLRLAKRLGNMPTVCSTFQTLPWLAFHVCATHCDFKPQWLSVISWKPRARKHPGKSSFWPRTKH